jgi:dienelactone hydrolase
MKAIVRIGVAMTIGLVCGGVPAAQVQDPSAALVAKAQNVVDLIATQEFSRAVDQFDAVMKGAMPEDKLRAAWTALIQQVGAFKQRGTVTAQTRGLLTITRVRCHFEKRDLDVQVVFDRDGLVGGLAFLPPTPDWAPPPYATAGAYTETEMTVGADRWPLPGTLTIPSGAGPFPALVLVHGSGPSDRDESFGPNKPFKDLALGLASRGIAVLRFEKRTQQYAGKLGSIAGFTVKDESIDDALAAVAKLRGDSRIDPRRVFVLGHSLGGTLVPRIAAADPAIAGIISLAGATRKIEDAMLAQINYLVAASGPVTPDGQKQIDDTTKLVSTVRALKAADASDPKSIGGAPAAYWLDLEAYDPVAVAATLKTPMLILQGERDYQVTMAEDFARWKTGLASRANVTFKSYPALNHLFLAGTVKSLPAEYNVPGHVAEDVIADIAQWIRTGRVQP